MKSSIIPIHVIDGSYITEWLVLGPFFPYDLETDFLASGGGEANIQPKEGDTLTTENGTRLTWKRCKSKGSLFNPWDAVGNQQHTTVYTACILQSDSEGDAQIHLERRDGCRLWITMWINTPPRTWRGGVSRYDGKSFVNFTMKDGLANNHVRAIYRDPDGVMWFGTGSGVSQYDGKGFVNFTMKDGLANNYVRTIHRDPDGIIWFGTGSGVSRYDENEF